MAITTEKLIIQLEAKLDKYEKNLAKASRSTDSAFNKMERRGKAFESKFNAIGLSLAGIFAGVASARGAQQLIDAATRIENSLKVAGLSGSELTTVYDALFASAQKSAAPFEALVDLYGRAALVQKELGVSSAELLNFTDKIAVALRVSGKSASESSGALLQLSQALGSGVVRAEEFNSILEGALPIAQAAAAGLEEAGGSVAKLRQLVVDGKVSSEAFFRAFEAGSVILEGKVANAELTVSQSFTRLSNVLIDTAGKLNDATDASSRLTGTIDAVSDAVAGFGSALDNISNNELVGYIGAVVDAYDRTAELVSLLGGLPGLFKTAIGLQADLVSGKPLGNGLKQETIQGRIDGAFIPVDTSKSDRIPASTPTDIGTVTPLKTVSLKNFAAPSSGSKKKSGVSGRSKKDTQNEFQREVQQIKERTAAIQAETVAMSGLNPLIDDYGFTLEKARSTQELINAAQKAGLSITPELKEKIDALATTYAEAAVEGKKLEESQDKIRESAEEMNQRYSELGSFAGDIFSQIADGSITAGEGLKKLALQFAAAYVKAKLLASVNTNTAGGSFLSGFISSIFGGIKGFASGGYHKGGLRIVGENGPEIEATGPSRILNARDTKKALSANSNAPSAANQNINVHITGRLEGQDGLYGVIDQKISVNGQRSVAQAVGTARSSLSAWQSEIATTGK